MVFTVIAIVLLAAGGAAFLWQRNRQRKRRILLEYTISAQELYEAMQKSEPPRLFDVRQPLDLLAHSEIIPASERIAPKDLLENPSLISKDVESVVYCTCEADETAIEIVQKALSLNFVKVRLLRGGLESWKTMGYPVERYDTVFHLDTPV